MMDNAFRNLGSIFPALVLVVAVAVSGCETPGSVGSNLTNSGADLVVDTFTVENVSASEFNTYSGDFSYFSAGQFQDPLFGNMTATGLIKPALQTTNDISEDAKMLLRVLLDNNQVYGDSLTTQEFDIFEINERWRRRAFLVKDTISIDQNTQIGSFTIDGQEDSLDVDITNWLHSRYRQYTTYDSDSLAHEDYEREVNGLALVPTNSNKIVPLESSSMSFVIQNPEADTFSVGLSDWAYSLERTNNNSFPAATIPLYSTFESVINFDHDLSEIDVRGTGISKAELKFYLNTSLMEQSLPSQSVQRPPLSTAELHLAEPAGAPLNLDPGNPITTGTYSESEGTFNFDITIFLQSILTSGLPEDQEFFITIPNNGIIKPGLIYTDQAPADKSPKLIITSVKNSDS